MYSAILASNIFLSFTPSSTKGHPLLLPLAAAPRSVLEAPLGHAIMREGVCDMDVPYYMLAVHARNRRLFGRRRRLWREWAARQGPQYRWAWHGFV